MRHGFQVEIREAEGDSRPTLRGTMLTEGRAASGGRAEVFAPLSVEWPSEGVAVLTEHRGRVEIRAQVVRQPDGRLSLTARATSAIRRAVKAGKRYMSVEFVAVRARVTAGGVREILSALVPAAALTASPEYDTTSAELRDRQGRRRLWL